MKTSKTIDYVKCDYCDKDAYSSCDRCGKDGCADHLEVFEGRLKTAIMSSIMVMQFPEPRPRLVFSAALCGQCSDRLIKEMFTLVPKVDLAKQVA